MDVLIRLSSSLVVGSFVDIVVVPVVYCYHGVSAYDFCIPSSDHEQNRETSCYRPFGFRHDV